VLQRRIQQLLWGWVAERKLAQRQTMAHLALRRLQELGIAGCERTIERIAFSVSRLPLLRRCPAHRYFYFPIAAKSTRLAQSRACGLDGHQA
jgi:hypothetical protein